MRGENKNERQVGWQDPIMPKISNNFGCFMSCENEITYYVYIASGDVYNGWYPLYT